MALTRWEPFQEMATLRQAMDRLFDDRFFRPVRLAEAAYACVPMDVYEEADKYVVEAALPGLKADDVDISLQGNTLTISGNAQVGGGEGRSYLLRERVGGRFTRTINLPVEIQSDKVEATFSNGVLQLSLPKAPAYQPKRISIKTAG